MEVPKLVVLEGGKRPEPPGDYIHQVFGSGGFLDKIFPGYQPRDGQIKLARAIDRGIRDGRHVIGEGPTGTGKSLAYSVPAAYHAAHSGKRVCIITANKNLQRQIYQKDLADLAKAVPWKFKYAIRKGHNSYLCLRDFENETYRDLLREAPEFDDIIDETAVWAAGTTTGDFEDSPGPPPRVWGAFSTSREECDGRKCGSFEECFAKLARDRAQKAEIIVTNYHLFFLHLKLGEGSRILPPFDVVILDEAHNAAGIARDFFGQEMTFGAIYRCVSNMHSINAKGFRDKARDSRDEVLRTANILWGELSLRARTRRHIFADGNTLPSEALEKALLDASEVYRGAAHILDPSGDTDIESAKRGSDAANYRKLADLSKEKSEALGEFRVMANEFMTYFVEGSGAEEKGKYVRLKSKAVEVGGYLRRAMFERYPTVIQTSATLAVRGGNGGDFAYVRREMGMGKMGDRPALEIEELVVESPFDWPKQSLLVIPRSMPEPKHEDEAWDQAVCDHLERIVNIVYGRTLGLFTSYRMLQKARDHLRATTKWKILVQGEGTNRELAERFQSDVGSVLLGTESFSEGISIEGEACTCVVLDKIPFINKNDPIVHALDLRLKRRKSREHVFQSYMLPEAVIDFKQRVGRLIRTVDDVGVIVALDKRLLTMPYRTQFTKSIPPIRRADSLDAIKPFLEGVGAL
jgi:ATP-dependent DNA helicase DinG